MHLAGKLRVEPGPITAEKVLQVVGARLAPYRPQVAVVEQEAGYVFNLGSALAERTGRRQVFIGQSLGQAQRFDQRPVAALVLVDDPHVVMGFVVDKHLSKRHPDVERTHAGGEQ